MDRNMILRIFILHCCLVFSSADLFKTSKCLMGYMTDVQSWVDEYGRLTPDEADIENTIDLSMTINPVPNLHHQISLFQSPHQGVKYLSLAKCQLTKVPPIFLLKDSHDRFLASTVQYMTFYGNSFMHKSTSGKQYTNFFNATYTARTKLQPRVMQMFNLWSEGFVGVTFPNLKELDLRSCAIQFLSKKVFIGMPNLEALYIGENEISYIEADAFAGLHNLRHLDFSRNQAVDEQKNPISIITDEVFALNHLKNLVSLDFSHTKLSSRNLDMVKSLGKSLKSLSLCETGLHSLTEDIFSDTSLEALDLSCNGGLLTSRRGLKGIEDSLKILYAKDVGLYSMDIFQNFSKLEILQLADNEINSLNPYIVQTFSSLQILDLRKNRLTSWFGPLFSLMPNLKYLSLKDNNLNVITEIMIQDVMNVDFLAISGNFIVCNCHAKDLFKMAAINEELHNGTFLEVPREQYRHNGYLYFNKTIANRIPVEFYCDDKCRSDTGATGKFHLLDHSINNFICLMVPESRTVPVQNVTSCRQASRDTDFEKELAQGRRKLMALLAIPVLSLPVAMIFVFRRHFRYFFITIRNSAMLSLINKKEVVDDTTIFNYDVFVSYCNEDRGWVLDHLLPQMEAECSISVCLHERDFQVGLSILENIVSCMDRSRTIMLILSQRFLLSQWCQFEMHLAQHRLLETRREDLTLVLLEDIPRRLRPNTLHYLMLTKTYIVWPKGGSESERNTFWRRLKKTLISQKNKHIENVSLA